MLFVCLILRSVDGRGQGEGLVQDPQRKKEPLWTESGSHTHPSQPGFLLPDLSIPKFQKQPDGVGRVVRSSPCVYEGQPYYQAYLFHATDVHVV